MKTADISELWQRIDSISRNSWLGPDLRGVNVEPSEDGAGGEFLRVDLLVEHPERIE